MKPISDGFICGLEAYAAQHDVPLIPFEKKQRKDDVAAEYRKQFAKSEGVYLIGKAQKKAAVFGTEQRINPATGRKGPWIVRTTAMVNQYYVDGMDEDFGPFFLKFSSYNAKLYRLGIRATFRVLLLPSFEASRTAQGSNPGLADLACPGVMRSPLRPNPELPSDQT
jgi:hypothetical protein